MPAFSPVRGGVPGQRIVAATDVAAGRTAAQVHPPTAGGIALSTADSAGRHRRIDISSHRDSFSGMALASHVFRITPARIRMRLGLYHMGAAVRGIFPRTNEKMPSQRTPR